MIAYLAHPIGETNGEDAVKRGDNIANALAWANFFAEVTQWTICAPWYIYVLIEDSLGRHRRIPPSLEVLERCDILILTGGHISGHMRYEIDRAKRKGIPILDLTVQSVAPPDKTEEVATHIVMRARKAVLSRPRRVWMPLITADDIRAMQAARHALYTHMPDEHPVAVGILDRIIAAALEDPIG